MHRDQLDDHTGDFEQWRRVGRRCPKCNGDAVLHRTWESSCGGYTDHQYKCEGCDHTWWIDGPDA